MIKYAAVVVGGKLVLDHFAAYGADRWRYLVAACALALAVALEVLGDARHATWHASYIVAFGVFTALNVARIAPRENLAMLVATTAIVEGANRLLRPRVIPRVLTSEEATGPRGRARAVRPSRGARSLACTSDTRC